MAIFREKRYFCPASEAPDDRIRALLQGKTERINIPDKMQIFLKI